MSFIKNFSFRRVSTLAIATLTLAACSVTSSIPSGKLLEHTQETGKLIVGLEGTYRPYSFTDKSGKLAGIEVDIMRLLAKDIGAEVTFTQAPWDSLIAGVDAGKYSVVINNLTVSDERKKKYDFTIPYTRDIAKFAVKADSPLQSITDITTQKAAQSTTSNLGLLAKNKFGLEIVPVEGFAQAINLVEAGRAELTLNSVAAFKTYQETHPDAKIRLLDGEVTSPDCCSILVKKGEEDFVAALNEAIKHRLADGSIAEITKKYVGIDISAADTENN